MCTCVRAYMRACVSAYARTHVRMYAYEYAYDVFPAWAFPHRGLYESPRYRHASRYRGLPHVRTHVACTHVRMYAHEYAYDVFPAWAFPRIGLCESRYRSLPLASDPFKKRTSLVRLTCAATSAHNYGSKQNKQNGVDFASFPPLVLIQGVRMWRKVQSKSKKIWAEA